MHLEREARLRRAVAPLGAAGGLVGEHAAALELVARHLGTLGRWAFAELSEIYQIEADFEAKVASAFDEMIARAGGVPPALST